MTPTATIDALCRAIDAGDDGLLPILADLLEEAGDARAAGLRQIPSDLGPVEHGGPYRPVYLFAWESCGEGDPICWSYGRIPQSVYARLRGGRVVNAPVYDDGRGYRTRAAAYLALAAALEERP